MRTLPPPQLTSRSALPLYRQVEQYLREQIATGTLRAGEILPPVRELCEQFGGINHLTVRQALKNLTDEKLIRSVQGRGCFVTDQAKREPCIAIILPQIQDTIFVRIAKGAQEVLEESGVRCLILDSRGSENTEADHLHMLSSLPVNGAIVFPITHSKIAEQIFRLKMRDFSFVLVDRYFEDIATSYVMSDSFQAGYESTRYLLEKNHRHIAWIGETRSSPVRLRLQGSQAAIKDAGLTTSHLLIQKIEVSPAIPSSYRAASRQEVHAAVDEILEKHPNITALMCSEDSHALSALTYLQEKGIQVPQQMAIIGYDDVPEAAFSRPALTTVRQPMIQIGAEAARLLLKQMEDGDLSVEKKTLPTELIVRETV